MFSKCAVSVFTFPLIPSRQISSFSRSTCTKASAVPEIAACAEYQRKTIKNNSLCVFCVVDFQTIYVKRLSPVSYDIQPLVR